MAGENLNIALTLSLQNRLSAGWRRAMQEMKTDTAAVQRVFHTLNNESDKFSRTPAPAKLTSGLRMVIDLARQADRALKAVASAQRGITAGVAGYQAGKYVLSQPIGKTMDYDRQLASMANTAFSDRNPAGRIAGIQELNGIIMNAVRVGGGTREGAAQTLNNLLASGTVDIKSAGTMLPSLTKYATASGADPNQLADIAIRGMQSFGIKLQELPKVLDMAIAAGQAGGFELKDMAKWLPQQMAAARLSGLNGIGGMQKLLAANQASVISAGTRDEAGNNLVNLLAKINSNDTAKDAAKVGIDLSGTLARARGKGMDSLTAFVAMVDKIAGSDAQYVALRKKASTATGTERGDTYSSMADILQGKAIGQIIQDRQALMALVALMNNRGYMADVETRIGNAGGTGESNFAVMASTPSFKVEQAAQEKNASVQTALDTLNPALGKAAEWYTAMAREYPKFTAALTAATIALTALAAAGAAVGLTKLVTGGGAAAAGGAASGVLARAVGTGGAMLLGAGSMSTIASMGAGAVATAGGAALAAGGLGYGVGTVGNYGISGMLSWGSGRDETLGGMIHELVNKEVKINVDVKNGNITAEVDKQQTRGARRR